jgi:hypothetical protein
MCLVEVAMTVPINVEPLVTAIAERVAELVRPIIQDELRSREGLQGGATLQPLATILDVSTAAARMRLIRDPELRSLGLRAGRRLLFRPADVEALLAARARESSR